MHTEDRLWEVLEVSSVTQSHINSAIEVAGLRADLRSRGIAI